MSVQSTMLQLGQGSLDGDLTQILYDRDGVLSGTAGSYILRADNMLLNRPQTCSPLTSNATAVVCGGSYGQVAYTLDMMCSHTFTLYTFASFIILPAIT